METRKLGSLDVPAVGLGTYQTFDVTSESEIDVRIQVIDNCLSGGTTFVDTAAMYGEAERLIGLATEGRRDKFQLATKVRVKGKEEGGASVANSFRMLKTDYIDVFQVHNLVDWRTHLPTLERLKGEGKIGQIGVSAMASSTYPEVMEIMRSRRITTVQIPYNVVDRAVEEAVLPLATDLDIGVIVMEPLKKGRYVSRLRREPNVTPLNEHGITTWAQALIAWVLGHEAISVAIPATTKPKRVLENAVAGSVERLPQELRDYVRDETERCL